MRTWFTLISVLFLTTAVMAQSEENKFGKPHAKAPKELSQMAFLIGEWHLDTWFTQRDGSKKQGTATLSVRYCLDGFGVEVQSRYPSEGDYPDFLSRTVYVFNSRLKKWVGTGINSLGNGKQYEVTFEDGKMVAIQSGMLFEGRKGINRITYSDIEKSGFKLIHEHAPDEGKSWQESAFGYTAKRLP